MNASTLTACASGLLVCIEAERRYLRRAERRAKLGPSEPARPKVAALAGALVAMLALAIRPIPESLALGITCGTLLLAAESDARTGFLFDELTLPCAIAVFLTALVSGHALWAIAGTLVTAAPLGILATLSRGRALGFGDVKAAVSIGGAFGPVESPFALLVACASGLIYVLVRRPHNRAIAFGPHLAFGSTVALLFGNPIARFCGG